MKKTLRSRLAEKERDPILQKMLDDSAKHIEPVLSDSQRKWFEEYNTFQQKQEDGLLYLMEEILEEKNVEEKLSLFKMLKRLLPSFPSERKPALALYGAEEEPQLEVKLEPLAQQPTQHIYNFNIGQEIQFYCSPKQEGYLFVVQEEILNETERESNEAKSELKFIAPDEDAIRNQRNPFSFRKSDLEKLPAMANLFNLFNYAFDQKGHFRWVVLAMPEIHWDQETLEKEELLSWLTDLFVPETKPSCVVLEINVL